MGASSLAAGNTNEGGEPGGASRLWSREGFKHNNIAPRGRAMLQVRS